LPVGPDALLPVMLMVVFVALPVRRFPAIGGGLPR
jgi:hypothetical protein